MKFLRLFLEWFARVSASAKPNVKRQMYQGRLSEIGRKWLLCVGHTPPRQVFL